MKEREHRQSLNIANKNLWLLIVTVLYFIPSTQAQQYKIDSTILIENTITFTPKRQDSLLSAKFFFDLNTYHFDPSFKNNQAEIKRLDNLLRDSIDFTDIDSVRIFATSSIDGPIKGNEILANRRAVSIQELMLERYPMIDSSLINLSTLAEDWATFEQLVREDTSIPSHDSLISIIEKTRHRDPDAREWLIRTLDERKPWNYLKKNVLSQLRYGVGVTLYYNITSEKTEELSYRTIYDTTLIEKEPVTVIEPTKSPKPKEPWFALKTNLLYDAVTLWNGGIEIPIGKQWSVMGEFISTWWEKNDDTPESIRNRTQVRNISLEGRRWFGNNEHLLTGWFAGIHATYGSFDIERNRKGKQSKNIISGGVVGGFAHTLNKSGSLRMEYALGLGYATLTYKDYTSEWNEEQLKWEAYRDQTVHYNWLGPTKLGVSLVWMLDTPRWFNKNKEQRKGWKK